MLKHVQTSPHRNISSSSLKRIVSDDGSPKHIRQSSTPSSLSIPRQSPSPSNSDSSWFPNSTYCKQESSSFVIGLDSADVGEKISTNEFSFSKDEHFDKIVGSNSSVIICPNCHKKKKLTVISNGDQCHQPLDSLQSDSIDNLRLSCETLEYSLKCLPVKNGGVCACNKIHLQNLLIKNVQSPNQHPKYHKNNSMRSLSTTPSHERNSSPSSGLSSYSSSSSSLSSSAKSPQSSLRTQCHKRILEEKAAFGRSDDVSLNSSISCSTSSHEEQPCSFTSSIISLQDNIKQTTVRVWVRCLLQEMEYKTLCVTYSTTCRQVVGQLLSKFKMKHRDPNLFYLAMEVTIRKAGAEVRTCLQLDDSAFPAQLVECHPKEDSRLALRMRRGGLLRIYDEALSQGSHYKSLLVGEKISCADVAALVLACNKVSENPTNFSLFEVWPDERRERVLYLDEEPMLIASQWPENELVRFEIRRYAKLTNHDRTSTADAIIQTTPSIGADLVTSKEEASTEVGTDSAVDPQNDFSSRCRNTKDNNGNISSCNKNLNKSLKSLIISNSVKLKLRKKERTKSGCFDNFYLITKDKRCDSNPELSDDSSSGFSSISPSPEEQKHDQGSFKSFRSFGSNSLPRQRRKLPQPPPSICQATVTLIDEGCLPELPASEETRAAHSGFKTYNDYENYFYI